MRLKKIFSVFLFIVLLVSPVLFFSGCFSDDEEDELSYKTIQINTLYLETIKAYATKVYKVDIPIAGNYYIGIKDLDSDCGITCL